MVSFDEIAEVLRTQMVADEGRMDRLRTEYGGILARYDANKKWLETHGYIHLIEEAAPPEEQKDAVSVPSVSPDVSEKTIHELALEILRQRDEMTITDLYDELVKKGKTINRASLDRALRRFPNLFVMEKRGSKNFISSRQREQKTA